MTGKSGVATAVAAPTIVQRIGNGATLLGGGVAVLMRRCGVAAASMRRRAGLMCRCGVANPSLRHRAGLSRRLCCLCGAFTAQLRSAPLRGKQPRISGRARDNNSILRRVCHEVEPAEVGGSQLASVLQHASYQLRPQKRAVLAN